VKAEREFEAQRNPYRPPVHAAVYRVYERPDVYLARVATKARYDGYVERRADCARQLAAMINLR
jgi:hypothetical protein